MCADENECGFLQSLTRHCVFECYHVCAPFTKDSLYSLKDSKQSQHFLTF